MHPTIAVVLCNTPNNMDAIRTFKGLLYKCHYIYVKDCSQLSEDDFLELLGLKGYRESKRTPTYVERHANIMRSGDWLGFADDWRFTVYHSESLTRSIKKLAKRFEVLHTAMGDADDSFEFYHYLGGKRVRAFSFDSLGTRHRIVTDIGIPFLCETSFENNVNPWGNITAIAQEAGVDLLTMASSLQTYFPNQK